MIDWSEEQKILIRYDDNDKIYLYTYRRCVESNVLYNIYEIYTQNTRVCMYVRVRMGLGVWKVRVNGCMKC